MLPPKSVNMNYKSNPLQALTAPEGSRRLRLPDFKTISTWSWQGCQRIRQPPLPLKIFLVLISVRNWVDPRAVVWPEGLCQWKIPVKPSGMNCSVAKSVSHVLNDYRKQNQFPLCYDLQVQYKQASKFLYSSCVLCPTVLIDKSPMKWMKIWEHGRDSSWITGGAGQHHEMWGPEILSEVGEALSPVYKL
jgi:hypothetical protein